MTQDITFHSSLFHYFPYCGITRSFTGLQTSSWNDPLIWRWTTRHQKNLSGEFDDFMNFVISLYRMMSSVLASALERQRSQLFTELILLILNEFPQDSKMRWVGSFMSKITEMKLKAIGIFFACKSLNLFRNYTKGISPKKNLWTHQWTHSIRIPWFCLHLSHIYRQLFFDSHLYHKFLFEICFLPSNRWSCNETRSMRNRW